MALVAASCAATSGVRTESADQIPGADLGAPFEPVPDPDDLEPAPSTTDPGPVATDPDTTDPGPVATDPEPPDPTVPSTTVPLQFEADAIDFGPEKPGRDYDEFLLATATDLDNWWATEFPAVYGEEYVSLRGAIYAAYPQRPDDIPGCGTPRTSYDDVQDFVAFYCGLGDFMVYDDGSNGLLFELAESFGPATIGIVLAHEYGHAIQQRIGALDDNLPTVITEQQADCFAGAWAGRAARGEAPGISFTDADVRAGLIAMIRVEDPLGIDQFTPGGHGSGFDRVGAFQVGFQRGAARCAELLDDPLPLTPNQFRDLQERQNQGNADFGFGETELLGFLPEDLNLYWDVQLDATFTDFDELTLVPVSSPDEISCGELVGPIDVGVAVCKDDGIVYLNEPAALDLYDELGDFSIGYLIGVAWSEAVQSSTGSQRSGEERELLNDCLTGAWVSTVLPEDTGFLPQPRPEERTVSASPGDLTEAIQTAILIGDSGSNDNVVGSAFEKIDAFRDGVLGGLAACEI